jgi:hypothetical protein
MKPQILQVLIFFFFVSVRDRPFNLKGGYGFLFRSEICFRTTQELEYLFLFSRKARIFFNYLTLGYMKKTLNQIIFFSSTKISIFFSATYIGNQNIFLEKHTRP